MHVTRSTEKMMPAQLVNVAEAALGPLPSTSEFLDRLTNFPSMHNASTADVALFGDTFADSPKQPPGTDKNRHIALRAALDFQAVCKHKKVELENLDEWFTAFAKWTLQFDALFDEESARAEARDQRQKMCAEGGVVMRQWTPQTLKTSVNALAHLHRITQPQNGIVPSSQRQFPRFCVFFNGALVRTKTKQTLQEPVAVLQDSDVALLFEKTNWASWYEAQRMNILILSYQLGQRPETLVRFLVRSFHWVTNEEEQPTQGSGLSPLFWVTAFGTFPTPWIPKRYTFRSNEIFLGLPLLRSSALFVWGRRLQEKPPEVCFQEADFGRPKSVSWKQTSGEVPVPWKRT